MTDTSNLVKYLCLLALSTLLFSACSSLQVSLLTREPQQADPYRGVALSEDPSQAPEGVWMALGVALAYLNQNHREQAPPRNMAWECEKLSPRGHVDSGAARGYRFVSNDWHVTISSPAGAIPTTSFDVYISNPSSGYEWNVTVNASGTVVESS